MPGADGSSLVQVTFFQQLGTISNPFLISLVTTLVNVLSTPLSFWAIEKFGRRALLLWGATGMIVMQYIGEFSHAPTQAPRP